MKHLLLSFFLVQFVCAGLMAQVAPNYYWVRFTDKDNTPYSIEEPEAFLTERALQRREKQGIVIDESDLPVDPDYIAGVAATGAQIHGVSRWFNSVTVYTTDPSVLTQINNLPYVLSVQFAGKKEASSTGTEKPFFAAEKIVAAPSAGWEKNQADELTYDYGAAFNQINMLNGQELHNLGFAGQGMIIAVLDAGFYNADVLEVFDYLWDNDRILGYKDFVSPDNPNLFNSHTHGTSVLSTMGGYLPGQLVGTAPEASYWLLRSENGESEYLIEELNWVSAAEFADSVGADVINSSLGYTTFDDPSMDHTYADMDGNTTPITIGADKACSKGIIVVNSAGNSGSSSWLYIGAPADGDSVFSIGAVDGSGNYASFSSIGPTADGRIKPNVVAQGQGSAVINAYTGEVSFGSGTSFSSPITAGMVACLWQAYYSGDIVDITNAIMSSGSQANNPDFYLGYGIPDYMAAYGLLTGIRDNRGLQARFTITPNPVNKVCYLNLEGLKLDENSEIVVSTLQGSRLKSERAGNSQNVALSMDGIAPGVYVVSVTTSSGTVSELIVRQ
ncbi:MAG: S8 family serine peptidase [Bacteroidales bacterium]